MIIKLSYLQQTHLVSKPPQTYQDLLLLLKSSFKNFYKLHAKNVKDVATIKTKDILADAVMVLGNMNQEFLLYAANVQVVVSTSKKVVLASVVTAKALILVVHLAKTKKKKENITVGKAVVWRN